ncbi:hypothetical protein [Anabaena sp. CA = ATCC 33047]|uniref:hypothetical protein n=1 Tax=Anabaena sp. (strain CA / ATCC 33047) TaxID=52271 RepID=UPI00082EB145|nr:hypothetical protein [Anabaena sp. CA = ATCC 33047]
MPKKHSLSDLIQEEVQKFNPSEGESAINVNAVEVAEDNAATPEETSQPIAETLTNKRSNPTKADLEATIKQLQASLETSQQNEMSLKQKKLELESALAQQKAAVERITKELYEAKQTALQLAEANSQLIEENQSLKQKPPTPTPKQPEQPTYKPVTYRKSHLTPEKLPVQPTESQDNFSANTWLYD